MGRTACTEPQSLCKGDLYLFTNAVIVVMKIEVLPPQVTKAYGAAELQQLILKLPIGGLS